MTFTKEQVTEAWNNFIKFTATAEQHDFVQLAKFQIRVEPLYIDLCENWDDHHADIFMRSMKLAGTHFGFKVPELEGE